MVTTYIRMELFIQQPMKIMVMIGNNSPTFIKLEIIKDMILQQRGIISFFIHLFIQVLEKSVMIDHNVVHLKEK